MIVLVKRASGNRIPLGTKVQPTVPKLRKLRDFVEPRAIQRSSKLEACSDAPNCGCCWPVDPFSKAAIALMNRD